MFKYSAFVKSIVTDVSKRFCHTGPLSGIRILDLSRILAGPFATMILGDLGAEIIKVERPFTGDDTRLWGPPFLKKESCYFLSVNRNKKSIVVDLKSTKGIDIIRNLASKSDVLVENFIPGTLEKMNIGYDDLRKIAPKLIYCSITGYGRTGPYKHRAGLDVLAASIGGLIDATGPKGGEPSKVGVAMTDLATGLYLHGAVMAALIHRQKTNRGQRIDCDLLSTQVSCMVNLASNYLNAGINAQRLGTAHESIVPYQAFQTKDGYITVGVGNDNQFINFCEILEMGELLNDNRYTTNSLRVKNRVSLIQKLNEQFVKKTNKDWLEIFQEAKFPYGPINSLQETFADPQVQFKQMVQEIDHPSEKKIKVVGPAVEFSDSSNSIRSPPPVLGEHTKEVLMEITGYSPSDIELLLQEGVIGC